MILLRTGLRNLLWRPWQSTLSIIGIVIGVAVVLAIDIANDSARRAFQFANNVVAGHTTHHIIGGPRGLDEDLYRRLRVEKAIRGTVPVVEGHVQLGDGSGRRLQVLGIDPMADPMLLAGEQSTAGWNPVQLLSTRDAAVLLDSTAERLGLQIPSTLDVRYGKVRRQVRLVAGLNLIDELIATSLRSVLITDISTAQEILDSVGRLTRIDLELPDDRDKIAWLRSLLPEGTELMSSAARGSAVQQMTRAFHTNLTALSLLALVVGTFLIYNTLTISVLQRHRQLAILRTLGVSNAQLFALVVGEAMVLGIIGVIGGVGLGIALSEWLLRLVIRTINDLYFAREVQHVTVMAGGVSKVVLLGLGATLVAAVAPAFEASRVPPQLSYIRSGYETRAGESITRLLWGAVIFSALGAIVLMLPSRSLVLGFAGIFLILFAFVLLTPWLLVKIVKLIQPLLYLVLGLIGHTAARGVTATLSRTRIAVAALAVAVSTTVGVAVMITSFRGTVEIWLASYLRADIYLSTIDGSPVNRSEAALFEAIKYLPEVGAVSTGRRVTLEGQTGRTQLFVVDLERQAFDNFQLKHGDPEQAWVQFSRRGAVIVSEPYAYHNNRKVGDTLRLRTDQGERMFKIAGVYFDYGSDRGVVTLHRSTYSRYWNDPAFTSFALYLKPGADPVKLLRKLETEMLPGTNLRARSSRVLRDLSLRIFDRTFAVTNVLRLLAVIIAVTGILSALMSIQLERGKEFAILRANGFTPRQLWALVTTETGIMGFAAGVLALPLGLFMAGALIMIINRRSFGWTMQLVLTPEHFIHAVVLAASAGLIAGMYPALRIARRPPCFALRHE